MEGTIVGPTDGILLGRDVGCDDGPIVGLIDGNLLGINVGCDDGMAVEGQPRVPLNARQHVPDTDFNPI